MSRVYIKIKDGFLYEVISDDPGLDAWVYDFDQDEIGEPAGPFSAPVSHVRRERFDELLADSGTPDG